VGGPVTSVVVPPPPRRIIVAGSRSIENYVLVSQAIERSRWAFAELVSGRAPEGVDQLGERYAREHNIPIQPFPANWQKYGRHRAGRMRNSQMASYADALIAVWDGDSPGTHHMIDAMQALNKPTFVWNMQFPLCWQPCCGDEKRGMRGGCVNCGAPCI
jgi:hypothetical protein